MRRGRSVSLLFVTVITTDALFGCSKVGQDRAVDAAGEAPTQSEVDQHSRCWPQRIFRRSRDGAYAPANPCAGRFPWPPEGPGYEGDLDRPLGRRPVHDAAKEGALIMREWLHLRAWSAAWTSPNRDVGAVRSLGSSQGGTPHGRASCAPPEASRGRSAIAGCRTITLDRGGGPGRRCRPCGAAGSGPPRPRAFAPFVRAGRDFE
jgi:hypothetical protein